MNFVEATAEHISFLLRTNGVNHLKGVLKLRMLRESAAFFSGHCPCPKSSEYDAMSQSLCDKYPLLKDIDANDGKYWTSVKDYLSQRFRNGRRFSQPIDPPSAPDHTTAIINLKTLPLQTPQLDETAYDRNNESLKTEYKKKNCNNVVMKKLLSLTHEGRRLDISSCQVRLVEILEKYPFFSTKAWILTEFEMIVGNNVINQMKRNWDRYCPAIVSSCAPTAAIKKVPPTTSLSALSLLDKHVRTGPTAKHTGAYKVYEVKIYNYNFNNHSL
jgi:hypothetical protein